MILWVLVGLASADDLDEALDGLRFGLELLDPASRDGEVVLGVRTQAERVSDLARACSCRPLDGEAARKLVEVIDALPGRIGREGTLEIVEVGRSLSK